MKAIFLVRDNPEPPVNGYKKRNYYLLEALKAKGIGVELMVAQMPAGFLRKLLCLFSGLFSPVPFSVRIRTDRRVKNELRRRCGRAPVDLIICDGIHKSLNIPFDTLPRKVLYEHNIESVIAARYSRSERNVLKKAFACLEALRFRWLQKKMWRRFDYVVACSAVDKAIIENSSARADVLVAENGVDTQYFNPGAYTVEPNTLCYTGQIGWYPNEDALLYFAKEVLPIVRTHIPEVKLWIVGGGPSKKIRRLAERDSRIQVTGFVEDVREFLGKASVYIVPLRIGSGTRLKILEAMSMKKAVVSTPIGCEGLCVEDGTHLLVRDTPEAFAKAVIEALQSEGLRSRLGENARRLVEQRYDWKVAFKELDALLI